jgi:NAD+--asparagine ADP-ribosyltransferase
VVIQPDHNGTELNIKDLERYLKNYLPEYMIPSHYLIMQEIPLLENGKIDRKKLIQDTKLDVTYLHKEFVVPKTYMENWLSDLWKEVLECDYVSLYDEFFELGGNSISIMRLLHRINERLQLYLQVYDIVKAKSLEEMSKIIMTEFISNIDEQRMEEVLYQVESMKIK